MPPRHATRGPDECPQRPELLFSRRCLKDFCVRVFSAFRRSKRAPTRGTRLFTKLSIMFPVFYFSGSACSSPSPPGIPCLPERSRMPQEAPKRPQHGLQTAEEDLQWLSKIPQGSENPRKRKEYRKLFYMMPSRSRWTS